jgi:hypothetical protein
VARLKITLGELQESIGYKVLPILTKLGDSAIRIAEAFGSKGAAGGVNQLGKEIATLGTDADGMINTFGKIYNSIAGLVNGIMNALAIPLSVINFLRTGELGNYKVKGLPTFDQLMDQQNASQGITSARQFESAMVSGSTISGAAGKAPATIPPIPPKASKAPPSIFDNTSGNAGGFEQAGIGGIGPFSNITINLDASSSLISSPATIGQDIIDAILAAQRNSGTVFAPAATF